MILFYSPPSSFETLFPILLRQDDRPGTPRLAGTPALVRSAAPPLLHSRDGTSRWEKVKWLRMSASLCTFPWWWTPDEDSPANPSDSCRRVRQHDVPLKVSTGRGRLLRRGGLFTGADPAFAYKALMFVKCCVSAQLEQRCAVKNSSYRERRWNSGEAALLVRKRDVSEGGFLFGWVLKTVFSCNSADVIHFPKIIWGLSPYNDSFTIKWFGLSKLLPERGANTFCNALKTSLCSFMLSNSEWLC